MEIVTERLILREFVESDWEAVLAYQSTPDYLRYYEWTERTPEAVQGFVQMFLRHQQAAPRIKFQLAITLKDTHELIGNCGIRMNAPDAHQADIGYELAAEQWGKGYATEAAHAMIEYGFSVLKVHRIYAECVAENTASARVLEKLGMRLEGRLRDNDYFKGRWWDTLLYAILDYEWKM
jgi:[ribosomal protein S5]-alanine N-acetyltransferase